VHVAGEVVDAGAEREQGVAAGLDGALDLAQRLQRRHSCTNPKLSVGSALARAL
jgi:hypothetical protein